MLVAAACAVSTSGETKVELAQMTGARAGSVPDRPPRTARVSGCSSSDGVITGLRFLRLGQVGEDGGEEGGHLLVLEEEGVVAVGAVDLGVAGDVAPGGQRRHQLG